MARLPPRSTREIEDLLLHHGFRLDRVRGDHGIWIKSGHRPIPVLQGKSGGELSRDYVAGILRQAGISRADALAFWSIH
jgi:predicted RNA binding protein YcfA (HicA-like mRNA interferase family)